MKPGRKPQGKGIGIAALFERGLEFPYRVPEELLLPIEHDGGNNVQAVPVEVSPRGRSKRNTMPKERVAPGTIFKTCQWLNGEPKERQFCGVKTVLSTPYCAHHYTMSYTRLK